jgi:CBS domain-containing protein
MTIASILAARDGTIFKVSAETTVVAVVALLAQRRIGAVPVVDGDRVIGIMSERDVIYGLQSHGATILDWPVKNVMTAPAITIEPGLSLLDALALMTKRRIRHLPVVEGDRMIGFVSIGDIVKKRMDGIEAEAEAMRGYIQGA